MARSLAYTSHKIRQGLVLRDSSTCPWLFPQFKEEFDLPPHAPEDESLPQRQALRGHIGHEHGPGGQRESRGTDLAAFITGRLPQAPPARLSDVLRDPHGQQTRRQTLALAQRDGELDRVRGLALQ